jgi:aminoglycoside 3-N-acetyltransferase
MSETKQNLVVTRSRLMHDLAALGVAAGQVVMLHASVKAVGWIVGGPDVILQALREVLAPGGTLMMYVGWADGTQEMTQWPQAKRQAYEAECPAFDPQTSRAVKEWSVLTEYLRTTPGALRSAHPEASVAALGDQAEWLVKDHPLQYGYGAGSPFEKLVQAAGKVLLMGSPLDSITLLHYSENIARVADKRIVRYRAPLLVDGQRTWIDIEEYDTSHGIVDWPEDYFIAIARDYLQSGQGKAGRVGNAQSYLLDARSLHDFAVSWMENHFNFSSV